VFDKVLVLEHIQEDKLHFSVLWRLGLQEIWVLIK
jgi:hypothetical protein